MSASDGTVFGGTILTGPAEHAWVLENHGPEHVRRCKTCDYPYFSAKLSADTCYGCWYSGFMGDAESAYMPVLEALWADGVPAHMTQTGGMCLAIEVLTEDGYYLLTDREDVLSFEWREEDGWTLGYYGKYVHEVYGEDYDTVPFSDEEDMLQSERKTVEEAVRLFRRGREMIGAKLG